MTIEEFAEKYLKINLLPYQKEWLKKIQNREPMKINLIPPINIG